MTRSILITGCSSGIGHHAAHALQKRGYRVFATARKEEDVQRLLAEGLTDACLLDLDCSHSITNAVEHILQKTGGTLDALFNNGAYGIPGAVEDLSRDSLRQQFETNLFGWHELTCQVLPIMRQQGHGRIIQNSSVLGLITMQYRGAYNASKFALEGLTDTLRQELNGTGIHISLIEPGPITSRFRENAYQQFKQHIDPANSAHRSVYEAVERRLATADTKDGGAFTLGPEAVTKCLIHALENSSPKARYYVTFPTYLFGWLRRILSTRMLDRILLRVSDEENH
ncbi:SDR family oxidoreductase [Oceanospirillum sediminis]|uniref:SDR family oxidoreductase n=1 Tax=Oceanospirillum sediminis TaxID=2760088 RepID=A0A839IR29_9GAMM|nr:SDR family oxidoreductase [Oceanospirillum sediminis]MBB1487735.1 SDR family oxidoreductase [Oceanospirillum sediminis]